MYHFTYWLEHFKEMPPSKAQTIVKSTAQLSEKTAAACSAVSRLADCTSLGAFNRTRQAILRAYSGNLSQAEKRAMSLLGEFLEFREYSSFKFPEIPAPMLAEYCKTMQMAYSYKAVLIHELVGCNSTGVTSDDLVNKIIAYYRDRIDHGLIAEKDGSVFTKADVSFAAAKKTILNNPVQVLVDAKIIIWNKRTGMISFTSEYAPASDEAKSEVCSICKERLKRYYAAIKPPKAATRQEAAGCNKKLKTLLKRLNAEIQATPDKATKKRLTTIYNSICTELGVSTKAKNNKQKKKMKPKIPKEIPSEYSKLNVDDDRKIGTLVQESLAVLENIEYKFSKKQLDNLLSHDWSNTTLKLNYTFFKLVDESKPLSEQRVDHLGNSRYYSRVYTFDNKKYLVTSQWYAKSKPFFISWYNTLRNTKK